MEEKMQRSTAAWTLLAISLLSISLLTGGIANATFFDKGNSPSPPPSTTTTPQEKETPTATSEETSADHVSETVTATEAETDQATVAPTPAETDQATAGATETTGVESPAPILGESSDSILPIRVSPLFILIQITNVATGFFGLLALGAGFVKVFKEMEYGIPFLDTDIHHPQSTYHGKWFYLIAGSIVAWILTLTIISLNHITGLFGTLSLVLSITLLVYWLCFTPYAIGKDLDTILGGQVSLTDQLFWAITTIIPVAGPLIYIFARNKTLEKSAPS